MVVAALAVTVSAVSEKICRTGRKKIRLIFFID